MPALPSKLSPKLTSYIFVCGLCLVLAAAAQAQRYPFVRVGGPDAPKGCLYPFQGTKGGVWLATCESSLIHLYYFDGTRFFSPLKSTVPAAPSAEDSQGGLWLPGRSGIYRLYKGHVERVAAGRTWAPIVKVASDVFLAGLTQPGRSGQAWNTLVRISRAGARWKAQEILSSVPPVQFRLDRSGHILYGCKGGFCEIRAADVINWRPGAVIRVLHHALNTRTDYSELSSLVWRDRFGCVWLRSVYDVSYECPGSRRVVTLPSSVAGAVGMPQILELPSGAVVIPSFSRIAIGRPGKFRVITAAQGYPSVAGAIVTKEGGILIGNADGLFVFWPELKLEYWSADDGLDGNTWSVLRSAGRTYAIAGDSVRVLDRDRVRWRRLVLLKHPTNLISGPDGTVLVSGLSDGVVQMSPSGKILRRSPPADIPMLVRTPDDGQIWAAGHGIRRVVIGRNRLSLVSTPASASQKFIWDMKVGRHGSLWACDGAGFLRKDQLGWHLPPDGDTAHKDGCESFALGPDGRIWYSDFSTGIPAEDATGKNRIASHGDRIDLGPAVGHFLDFDRRGWLWRGASDGVYVADIAEARDGMWLHLGRKDGLPAVDANQQSFFEDSDGSVWFGADDFVIHLFPPKELIHPRYAPSLFISGFSWDGGQPRMADLMHGIGNGSRIVAYIGSLQFFLRNALRVRYRVLPDQTAWRATSGLELALGKLSWGSHTLEVQARIFTGPWSKTVRRSFTVLAPAALTWPFVFAYLALTMLLAAAGYWLYRRRQEEEATLLPNLAAWRMGALLPDEHALTGTVLNSRFEVGELLARGGFANVMAGVDRGQNQRCAIKIFRKELKDRVWIERRFEHEVSALQRVRHPNVVSIYAHGVTPLGLPYLVMEFVEGGNLRDVLDRGALPPERAAAVLSHLASALDAIHSQNIWHRDLKPENVMLRHVGTHREEPVLIDFSIAIVKSADETLHGLSRAAGTFDYMAPEQAIGYAQPSSDIYSLAKVVIEMLTGRRVSELLPEAALDLPERVRDLAGSLEVDFAQDSIDMLAAALEFDPGKRPHVASSFAAPLVRDLESVTRVRNC